MVFCYIFKYIGDCFLYISFDLLRYFFLYMYWVNCLIVCY